MRQLHKKYTEIIRKIIILTEEIAEKILIENGGKRRNKMDDEKHICGYRHRGNYWKGGSE